MTASRKLISLLRGGDLGFIAVVIVAYISAIATAGYAPRGFTPFRLALLIAAGLAFIKHNVAIDDVRFEKPTQ